MKWDVKLKDKIEYFDPSLSYEITKYIPINQNESLDFDPKPFTEAGQIKIKTGKYEQKQIHFLENIILQIWCIKK